MRVVRFRHDDLKDLLAIGLREGGWLRDDQEIDEVVLNWDQSRPQPTEPAQLAGPAAEGGDPSFDVRVDGVRIKLKTREEA